MHQGLAVLACWLALFNMASGCIRRLSYWQDLPLLAVEGCNNHYDLGLIQGATFGGLIRARVADSDVLATVQEYIDTPRGREVFNAMRALHEAAYPFYWQELNGLAAGSTLPLDTVFALNLRNELLAASRLDPQQAASTPQQQQQPQGQGMEEAVMEAKDKQDPQEQELQWWQHLLQDVQPGEQELQEEQEQQHAEAGSQQTLLDMHRMLGAKQQVLQETQRLLKRSGRQLQTHLRLLQEKEQQLLQQGLLDQQQQQDLRRLQEQQEDVQQEQQEHERRVQKFEKQLQEHEQDQQNFERWQQEVQHGQLQFQQEQQQWQQQALRTEQQQQQALPHTAPGQQHSAGRQVTDTLRGTTGEGCSDVLVTLVDTDPTDSYLPAGGLPDALPNKATAGRETASAECSTNPPRKLAGGLECRLSSSKAAAANLSLSLFDLAQRWSLSWPVAVWSWMWRRATGILTRTAGWGGAAGRKGLSDGAGQVLGTSLPQQPKEGASVTARRNQDGVTSFLGHNEDVSSDVVGRMYLLKAQMVGHPTFVALVYPGELPSTAFGINSAGIAFTLDALYPLQPVLPAIGRNWLSRAMLDAQDMGAAESLLNMDLQATGRCINLLDLRTCALSNTEIAPGGNASTLRVGVGSGSWEFHANMYQRMDVPEQPGQSSSHRQAVARKYPAPASVDDILELLGDESDPTWPIYRTGASSKDSAFTAFTILITASCTGDMEGLSSRVHILQGNPREKNLLLTLDGRTLLPLTAATREVTIA